MGGDGLKKSKTVTAVAFLVVLAVCLLLVLIGAARVALGLQKPVAVSRYTPGEEGVTYTGLVRWFEDTCRAFCTTELPGRVKLKEANASLNRLAGKWIFESTDPEVIRLNNGYFENVTNFYYYLSDAEGQVAAFRDYVESLGARYLYVQAPFKVCALDPQLPVEGICNTNEEASILMERLRARNVETLDLRESLHADGLDHYGCFYVTDHHWTMEAGLWAARTLAEELNSRYDLGAEADKLAEENFTDRVWEDAFLGSWGRKVTLAYAQPEDFILPVPVFEADLRLTVPPLGPDLSGGFEILYDESKIVPEDYYTGNSYGAVMQGDCPYIKVENLQNPDGPVVAILRESFAIAPSPYLSLAVGELHLVDARYYDGSIKALLAEIQPDVVLSLLNVQCHTGAYFDMIE